MCKHTRCPYTLESLERTADTIRGHIFPESIGGAGCYSLRVSKTPDNQLGSLVEAPLVAMPTLTNLRERLGVGSQNLQYSGTTLGAGVPISVTVDESGGRTEHVVTPAELDPSATSGVMYYGNSPRQERHFTARIESFYGRLGKDVEWETPERLCDMLAPDRPSDIVLVRGLAKVAYLATVECIGNDFLDDPLISDWHRLLFAETAQEASQSRITGNFPVADITMRNLLPDIQEHEHAVVVVNLGPEAPLITLVTLFGSTGHTLLVYASETSSYGLDVLEGKIAICDARTKSMRYLNFGEHLVQDAPRLGLWEDMPEGELDV